MANEPKRRRGRPKKKIPGRDGYNVNVWVNAKLGEVFEAFLADRLSPSKTGVVEVALEAFFRDRNLWPPPDEDPAD